LTDFFSPPLTCIDAIFEACFRRLPIPLVEVDVKTTSELKLTVQCFFFDGVLDCIRLRSDKIQYLHGSIEAVLLGPLLDR
jgi:hypothetical protein